MQIHKNGITERLKVELIHPSQQRKKTSSRIRLLKSSTMSRTPKQKVAARVKIHKVSWHKVFWVAQSRMHDTITLVCAFEANAKKHALLTGTHVRGGGNITI